MSEQIGAIRAGMGGWTFEPWNKAFYPNGLPKKRQLEYASRQVPAIEINGTYYRTQKPATFAGWAAAVPEDFVFTLKGTRFITNRRILGEAAESMEKFITSGIAELGERLGPILWQFAPTKAFDPDDFRAFLELLPASEAGVRLRHAVEVRHPSFAVPEFIELAERYGAGIVNADHETYPAIPDITADFLYCRLQNGRDEVETGYPKQDLEAWAGRAVAWAKGRQPDDLPLIAQDRDPKVLPRDVFVFFIRSGKVRAPLAAQTFMKVVTQPAN
ncbi:DUF72 domain-containing protein [Oricola cellulosilytica]|uniref:DUF72 domain-containing protein n=1 Tax=Oricola cellulosilytica TaxID=1429082 RepID=A0A4R0PA93_9HYPH|nr:DUF72 domain-containing protein [Oricola cellulosilytica]TCD13117.1 DUF72 domain-containing protein [Oricola cellulosilytica]